MNALSGVNLVVLACLKSLSDGVVLRFVVNVSRRNVYIINRKVYK